MNTRLSIKSRFWALFNGLTFRHAMHRFRQSRSGSVLTETAMVVPVLLLIAIGGIDFGRFNIEQSRLAGAARAGIQYVLRDTTNAGNITRIMSIMEREAGTADGQLSLTARRFCNCGSGEVSCTVLCGDGSIAPMYVEVTAQNDLDLFFSYPGVPDILPLSARSEARVR